MTIDWTKVKPGTEIEDMFGHRDRCKFIEIDPTDPDLIRYKFYREDHGNWFYTYGAMGFFKLKHKVLFEV
jgi:hypothetical protein